MSSLARSRRRRQIRATAACPDCNSDVRIVSDHPNLPHAEVLHDDTCPWYRSNGNGRPFRALRITTALP